MPVSSHVIGWNIPATETESGLSVVRTSNLWGWHYSVGQMNDALIPMHPAAAKAWALKSHSDERPGITLTNMETNGPLAKVYRATAALLYFCIDAQQLEANHTISVARQQPNSMTWLTDSALHHIGFSRIYTNDDLTAQSDHIHQSTARKFPEFTQAQPIPHLNPAA